MYIVRTMLVHTQVNTRFLGGGGDFLLNLILMCQSPAFIRLSTTAILYHEVPSQKKISPNLIV